MIRIELQIEEQSAVDSTFDFARGNEDYGTGYNTERSNLLWITNKFFVGVR